MHTQLFYFKQDILKKGLLFLFIPSTGFYGNDHLPDAVSSDAYQKEMDDRKQEELKSVPVVEKKEIEAPQLVETPEEENLSPPTAPVNEEEVDVPELVETPEKENLSPSTAPVNKEEVEAPQLVVETPEEENLSPPTAPVNKEEVEAPQLVETPEKENPSPPTAPVNKEEVEAPQLVETPEKENLSPPTALVNKEETEAPELLKRTEEEKPSPSTAPVNEEKEETDAPQLVETPEMKHDQVLPTNDHLPEVSLSQLLDSIAYNRFALEELNGLVGARLHLLKQGFKEDLNRDQAAYKHFGRTAYKRQSDQLIRCYFDVQKKQINAYIEAGQIKDTVALALAQDAVSLYTELIAHYQWIETLYQQAPSESIQKIENPNTPDERKFSEFIQTIYDSLLEEEAMDALVRATIGNGSVDAGRDQDQVVQQRVLRLLDKYVSIYQQIVKKYPYYHRYMMTYWKQKNRYESLDLDPVLEFQLLDEALHEKTKYALNNLNEQEGLQGVAQGLDALYEKIAGLPERYFSPNRQKKQILEALEHIQQFYGNLPKPTESDFADDFNTFLEMYWFFSVAYVSDFTIHVLPVAVKKQYAIERLTRQIAERTHPVESGSQDQSVGWVSVVLALLCVITLAGASIYLWHRFSLLKKREKTII